MPYLITGATGPVGRSIVTSFAPLGRMFVLSLVMYAKPLLV